MLPSGRGWGTPGQGPSNRLIKVGGYQEGTLARSQPSPGFPEPVPPDKHGCVQALRQLEPRR